MWAHVEDGSVNEWRTQAGMVGGWRQTSNLEALDADELAALGWHPVVGALPDFDPVKQHVVPTFHVNDGVVTATYEVVALPGPRIITYGDFTNLLSDGECYAMAIGATPAIIVGRFRLASFKEIDLDDPRLRAAMVSLVPDVFADAARVDAILAP